jgi:hypothetical protein
MALFPREYAHLTTISSRPTVVHLYPPAHPQTVRLPNAANFEHLREAVSLDAADPRSLFLILRGFHRPLCTCFDSYTYFFGMLSYTHDTKLLVHRCSSGFCKTLTPTVSGHRPRIISRASESALIPSTSRSDVSASPGCSACRKFEDRWDPFCLSSIQLLVSPHCTCCTAAGCPPALWHPCSWCHSCGTNCLSHPCSGQAFQNHKVLSPICILCRSWLSPMPPQESVSSAKMERPCSQGALP